MSELRRRRPRSLLATGKFSPPARPITCRASGGPAGTSRWWMRGSDTALAGPAPPIGSVSSLIVAGPPAEGHQREVEPVEVVVDVEVAGKSGAGVFGLVPASVLALRPDEPRDPPLDGGRPLPERVERDQRPGRLRRGAAPPPDPCILAVGARVLAPAAVGVLDVLQPCGRAAQARIVGRKPARHHRWDRGPGPVQVVHSPAAIPGALRFLLAEQKRDPSPRRLGCPQTLAAEHLEHVGGDVRAGLVDHLAKVAERDLATELASVVRVERPPATVRALNAERP